MHHSLHLSQRSHLSKHSHTSSSTGTATSRVRHPHPIKRPAQPSCWSHERVGSRHVVVHVAQRPLAAVLADIEQLKASADALELELTAASEVAAVAAKRSRRLAARSHELQDYALEHVMLGDEAAARSALQQKAAVADALRQATRRAETNSALARKLEEVLVLKQGELLAMIREANRQQAAAAAATAAGVASTAPDAAADEAAAGRGLKRSRSVAWSSDTLHVSSDDGGPLTGTAAAEAAAEAAAHHSHDGLQRRNPPKRPAPSATAGRDARGL